MNNIKRIFSVGASYNNVQNLNNKQLRKHIKETYKISAMAGHIQPPFLKGRTKNENFDGDILNDLKGAFLTNGQNYAKALFGTDENIKLKIDEIWGNTGIDEERAGGAGIHNHRRSLISGVYYLTKGKLSFLNPYQLLLSHVYKEDIVNYNEFNSDIWNWELAEGDMVFFNSALLHYAQYVTRYGPDDKHERMSIVCDMILDS